MSKVAGKAVSKVAVKAASRAESCRRAVNCKAVEDTIAANCTTAEYTPVGLAENYTRAVENSFEEELARHKTVANTPVAAAASNLGKEIVGGTFEMYKRIESENSGVD